MSDIASKTTSGASSSLAAPFAKKGASAEHELIFAALFGGVIAAGADEVSAVGQGGLGVAPLNSDADMQQNPDGDTDVLAAMQALAAMMGNQKSKDKADLLTDRAAEAALPEGTALPGDALPGSALTGDILLDDSLPLDAGLDGALSEDSLSGLSLSDGHDILANPMLVDAKVAQNAAGSSAKTVHSGSSMAAMAYEDGGQATPQNGNAGLNQAKSPQTSMHNMAGRLAGNASAAGAGAFEDAELDDAAAVLPERAATASKLVLRGTYQPATAQSRAIPSTNVSAVKQNANAHGGDGEMQFDNPSELMRVVAGQAERAGLRQTTDNTLSETKPAELARLGAAGANAAAGQMSQQNNGQSSGQSGTLATTGSAMTNGSMMEMLDMAQDNWTEMLLQRVQKGLAGGKDAIDFQLNPRNLGKMRINLMVQNERATIHIQTESASAAAMLIEAETRLVQMMDASGLKFGGLNAQQSQNFGGDLAGRQSGQGDKNANPQNAPGTEADTSDVSTVENGVGQSENLINMQA